MEAIMSPSRRTLATVPLLLSIIASPSAAQDRTIAGRVFPGVAGVPFAGAAVRVIETGTMVCADADGFFTIDAPAGEVRLRVIPVGFGAQEIVVARGDRTAEVPLGEHVIVLDEVVVVGYSGGFADAATGVATSTVSSREIDRVPAQRIEGALQGKVPGAVIASNSGAPGGGFQILMRGAKTVFGNSEPLVILDGVPISNVSLTGSADVITGAPGSNNDGASNRLADLNPHDVDRVEFLKGAAAAALYGSRAANGVILITTKRGQPQKPDEAEQVLQCFRSRD
jgi:TonB-dependent SusC/RagA subfamily outer membrane receptor